MSSTHDFQSPEFLRRLKERDKEAIEAVVRAYTKQLYNASLGLGFNDQEAHEVSQNTWLAFFKSIENFKGNSHIRTFLFGILYNKAREQRRETAKVFDREPIDTIMEERFKDNGAWKGEFCDPEIFYGHGQRLEIIERCLSILKVNQRMAFFLKEVEGHVSEEICNILEVSNTNLGVLLFRAKNKLRECIERKVKGEE
ncbi:MAG: RNA polymerase sigma factor [Bdellovibrionota bacterium]|nr:RNA polymerase sigma factor [Bdellovibrionota bacterium]